MTSFGWYVSSANPLPLKRAAREHTTEPGTKGREQELRMDIVPNECTLTAISSAPC
jgi:hypothetical protein